MLGILVILLLVSLWLRTRALAMHYWVDEGLSVGIASHHLSHIPALLREDGSPPLYYVLLHFWMALRGKGEVATHEFSLIFALLMIPVAYWAGASLFNRRTGVVTALLAALLPYLTTYAQETRMYALLALLAIVTSASFVHVFVFRRRRYLPVFAVALTASLYTHNWALFLAVAAIGAFLLCVWETPREQRRGQWLDGAFGLAAVAVMYAPWLPTLIYQARHTGAPWDLPPVLWSLSQGLYSLVGGRGAAVALLLAGGSGLLALRQTAILGERNLAAVARPQEAPRTLLLAAKTLAVLGFGTLLVAWLYSKHTPAWAIRYLAVIVGPLILLFAFALVRAGRFGLVALALVSCWWVLDPVPTRSTAKSNVGPVVRAFRADLHPGDLVLSTQPEQVPTIAYYLPQIARFGTPLGPTSDPRVVDWRNALAKLRRASVGSTLMPMVNSLASGQHVLLVVPQKLPTSPLWLKLIDRYSSQWANALKRDRLLQRVAGSNAGAGGSGLGVRATLFVVR